MMDGDTRAKIGVLLSPSISYNFHNGPDLIKSAHDAKKFGLNCVALAHITIRELLDYSLPADMHCFEMLRDTEHFADVEVRSDLHTGDLMIFGRNQQGFDIDSFIPEYDENGSLLNWLKTPVRHVAVAVGSANEGSPMLHATHVVGGSTIWPLTKFGEYVRYEKVLRHARIKDAH